MIDYRIERERANIKQLAIQLGTTIPQTLEQLINGWKAAQGQFVADPVDIEALPEVEMPEVEVPEVPGFDVDFGDIGAEGPEG